MRTGLLFIFLGIFLTNKCFCLKKKASANGFGGEYFSKVGSYNFINSKDLTFVKDYNLTSLENVLGNAKKHKEMAEVKKLETNLNKIYMKFQKNRANFVPFKTSLIPESQLKLNIEKALEDSEVILSELVSLTSRNFSESLGIKDKCNKTNNCEGYNYLFPKHVKDFEIAKQYIKFFFNLEKLSNHQILADVKMEVPILVKSDLYRIHYVPRKNLKSKRTEVIPDQSISNLVVTRTEFGEYFLIKNMDSCELKNGTFFCDPVQTKRVQNNLLSCASILFTSQFFFADKYSSSLILPKCDYEEATNFMEFTYVGDNQFYVFLTRTANYIYQCDDGRREEGELIFQLYSNIHYTGTLEVEENCTLRTAYTTVFNRNGVYEIQIIEDEELLKADVPKIIGIPIWIFSSVVVVICLVIFAGICICFRGYKMRQYLNVNRSGSQKVTKS